MPNLIYSWRQSCGALTRADTNFRTKILEAVSPKLLKNLLLKFLALGSISVIWYSKRKWLYTCIFVTKLKKKAGPSGCAVCLGSVTLGLLRLSVQIPHGDRYLSLVIVVMLSGRDLCNGLINRAEESWVCSVQVWSWKLYNEEALDPLGLLCHDKRKIINFVQRCRNQTISIFNRAGYLLNDSLGIAVTQLRIIS
jgi:hypothetical protein